jgi:hypothetical protein
VEVFVIRAGACSLINKLQNASSALINLGHITERPGLERGENQRIVKWFNEEEVPIIGAQWVGCTVPQWNYEADPIAGVVRAGLAKSGYDIQLFSPS